MRLTALQPPPPTPIALILVVGILAGFYPALYLSRFRPIAVLQGKTRIRSSKSFLRRALVVFQFTIAIGFVCTTTIVYKQFHYVTSMDLGFDRENILVLDFEGERASDDCKLMKSEILRNTKALAATANNGPPGTRTSRLRGLYTDPDRRREDMVNDSNRFADKRVNKTMDKVHATRRKNLARIREREEAHKKKKLYFT